DGGEPVGLFSPDEFQSPRHAVNVKVAWADQLGRRERSPQAEVHPLVVATHHPSQVHIQAFTSRLAFWRWEMFPRSPGMIFQAEEQVVKTDESLFNRFITPDFECMFQ